jgi:predicted GNAT family N-acyltransferase
MDTIKLMIANEEYTLIKNYKENEKYRLSFNNLAKKVYGIDFEEWYQQGYWGDKYCPYSIVHKEEVIANVSVSPIDFFANGKIYHTLQIGTVMTEEAYRRKGLSKELIDIILKEYEKTCELIYLYANDTVLDFYPKFGFVQAEEYNYSKTVVKGENKLTYRKLNIKESKDKALIIRLVTNTDTIAMISMVGNLGLDMFYLSSFMAEDIYYIEDLDLVAVAEFDGDNMFLLDVFCEHEVDLDMVIRALMNNTEGKVTLGFTPQDITSYTCELLREEGSTFFIKGEDFNNKGRFPLLSHA